MQIPINSVPNINDASPTSSGSPGKRPNSPLQELSLGTPKRARTQQDNSSSKNQPQEQPGIYHPSARVFMECNELRQRLLNTLPPKDYANVLKSQKQTVNRFLMDAEYKHVHKMLQDPQIFQDLVTEIESGSVGLGRQARLIPSMPPGPARSGTVKRISEELSKHVWLATAASGNPWSMPGTASMQGHAGHITIPQNVIHESTTYSFEIMRVICTGWNLVDVPIDFAEMHTLCSHAQALKELVNNQPEGPDRDALSKEMSRLEQNLSSRLLKGQFHPHTESLDACLSLALKASMRRMLPEILSISKEERLNLIEGTLNLYQFSGRDPISMEQCPSTAFKDWIRPICLLQNGEAPLDRDEYINLLASVTRKVIVAYQKFPDCPINDLMSQVPMPTLGFTVGNLMVCSGFSPQQANALVMLVLRNPPELNNDEQINYVISTARTLEPIIAELPGDVAAKLSISLLSGLRLYERGPITRQIDALLKNFLQDQHVSRMSDEDRSNIMVNIALVPRHEWPINPYIDSFVPVINRIDGSKRCQILGLLLNRENKRELWFEEILPFLEASKPYITGMPDTQARTMLSNILFYWRDQGNDAIPEFKQLQPYLKLLIPHVANLDNVDQLVILQERVLSLAKGERDANQFQPYVDILKPNIARMPDDAGIRALMEMSEAIATGNATNGAALQPYIARMDNETRGEMLDHFAFALHRERATFDQIQPYLEAMRPYIADMSAGHSVAILESFCNASNHISFKHLQPYFEILKPHFLHDDFESACDVIKMSLDSLAKGDCDFTQVQPFLELLKSEEFAENYDWGFKDVLEKVNNTIRSGRVDREMLAPYIDALHRKLQTLGALHRHLLIQLSIDQ